MECLNTLQKIKEFIEWCKKNKVKSFKHGDLTFELSEVAFIDQLNEINMSEIAQESREESKLDEANEAEEDKDMLFWSAE